MKNIYAACTMQNNDAVEFAAKPSELKDLSGFQLLRVLSQDNDKKKICVEGTFKGSDGRAVITFEKDHVSEEDVKALLVDNDETKFELTFENNIYRNFNCLTKNNDLNAFTISVIYPASEECIRKYTACKNFIAYETSTLYSDLTLPFIERSSLNLQWVYDILEHKREAEKIIYEDKCPVLGFVLLPHINWDQKEVSGLHVVAIIQQHGLKSIRDLNSQHVALLEHVKSSVLWVIFKNETCRVFFPCQNGTIYSTIALRLLSCDIKYLADQNLIKEKYGLCSSQVVIFFHYQPSYFHLHIHFTSIDCEYAVLDRDEAYLLSEVISNIELMPDYYQRATLPFIINESDDLYVVYKDQGLLNEVSTNKENKDLVKEGFSGQKSEETELLNDLKKVVS